MNLQQMLELLEVQIRLEELQLSSQRYPDTTRLDMLRQQYMELRNMVNNEIQRPQPIEIIAFSEEFVELPRRTTRRNSPRRRTTRRTRRSTRR